MEKHIICIRFKFTDGYEVLFLYGATPINCFIYLLICLYLFGNLFIIFMYVFMCALCFEANKNLNWIIVSLNTQTYCKIILCIEKHIFKIFCKCWNVHFRIDRKSWRNSLSLLDRLIYKSSHNKSPPWILQFHLWIKLRPFSGRSPLPLCDG